MECHKFDVYLSFSQDKYIGWINLLEEARSTENDPKATKLDKLALDTFQLLKVESVDDNGVLEIGFSQSQFLQWKGLLENGVELENSIAEAKQRHSSSKKLKNLLIERVAFPLLKMSLEIASCNDIMLEFIQMKDLPSDEEKWEFVEKDENLEKEWEDLSC